MLANRGVPATKGDAKATIDTDLVCPALVGMIGAYRLVAGLRGPSVEEFIFDDDVDEVGAETEAHCPKCKADTTHVVVSKYEDEIRRVQCNQCGDVHAYRK